MRPGDAAETAAIGREAFPVAMSEKMFREELSRESTIYLVAENDNGIAGYCGMQCALDEGSINCIAVKSECRGRGIASSMLSALVGEAKEKGIGRVWLEVRQSNAAALALYGSAGFEKTGIRKNFYEKPREDAIVMRLSIKPREDATATRPSVKPEE